MRRSMPESCWLEQGAGSSDFSLRIPPGMARLALPKGDFTAYRKRLSSADPIPSMWLLPGQSRNEHSRAVEIWVSLTLMK